jgi:hypothetical protein
MTHEEMLEFLRGLLTYVEDGSVQEIRECGFVNELQGKIAELEVRLGDSYLTTPHIEVDLGQGVMQWDDDGTIRYIDHHGNTEGLWRPGDEEYARYKATYFPHQSVSSEEAEDD